MGKTEAVLDSDFIQGLLKWGTKDFFKQLMDELDVTPFVHPYVAEVELQYCISIPHPKDAIHLIFLLEN